MAHSLAAATARGAALAAAPISSRVGLGFATRPRCPPTATVPTRSGVNLGRRHRTITTTTNSAGAAMAGAAAAAAAESSPGDDDALRLGFIGAGAMAEAMARGFVKGGVISFDRISASNSGNRERAAIWRDLGVDVCASNAEVLRKSDVVFLAVKPHILPGVLAEIAADAEDRHLFVSVAAGVSTTFIEQAIKEAGGPETPRVIRVMPNTPCLVGAAASAACAGTVSTPADLDLVSAMMSAAGTCLTVEERLFDAVVRRRV